MPVQTRARGQTDATKVYKSGAVEPKQQLFPARRRQIKTYGRPVRSRSPRQGTLTQMDFVAMTASEDAGLVSDGDEEEDFADLVPYKVPATTRVSRGSRRKTTGDAMEDEPAPEKQRKTKRRRTVGDPPSTSSSFHTQTITQFFPGAEEFDQDANIADSEAEEDLGVVKETPRKASREPGSLGDADPNSVTPLMRRIRSEIPSSQSPATPLLLRYSPANEPSPLRNKSFNISALPRPTKAMHGTPRDRVIQDSYSTTGSSPTTPTPKAKSQIPAYVTPVKKLRFDLPEDKENITPGRIKPKSPKSPKRTVSRPSRRQPLREVPDSDDEFQETDDEDAYQLDTLGMRNDFTENRSSASDENAEKLYAVGDDTQAVLISSGAQASLSVDVDERSRSLQDDRVGMDAQAFDEYASDRECLNEVRDTGTETEQIGSEVGRACPGTGHAPSREADNTQAHTQGLESQRVPLEIIQTTGPISTHTDIIISIYGEHVKKMTARTKTHEFRKWKIPDTVYRVWIYITKPVSELKYMCIFGPPKMKGQIHEDGEGNGDFNRGKKPSTYAYEILQMFELNNPVPFETLRDNGWPAAPQKYQYIPPAIVGQLTSNLRCTLWGEEAEQGIIPSSPGLTESQELANQIRSDIDHATQLGVSELTDLDIIPSSQSPRSPSASVSVPRVAFARPALPKTTSASSAVSLPTSGAQSSHGLVRASQATTTSQISSSSLVASPENPLRLPRAHGRPAAAAVQSSSSSSPTICRQGSNSLRSSQFPTKSQLLPDSLLHNEIREPPSIIWDSADEDSE